MLSNAHQLNGSYANVSESEWNAYNHQQAYFERNVTGIHFRPFNAWFIWIISKDYIVYADGTTLLEINVKTNFHDR